LNLFNSFHVWVEAASGSGKNRNEIVLSVVKEVTGFALFNSSAYYAVIQWQN
jgi:hypothetical protein